MPRYRVSSPEGVTYMVDAPDGMTDEQVLEYAKQPHSFTGPATATDRNAVESLPGGQYLPVNPLTIGLGSTLVGAGRTGSKIEAGNQQLVTAAKGTAKQLVGADNGPESQALTNQAQMQRDNDAAYAPLRKEHPFFTGAGESSLALAVPVGQATMAARVFAPALGLGGMGAMEYGTPQQRALNGGKGFVLGGLGGGVGEILSSAIAPASSRLTGTQQQAVQTAADRLGIKPLPSEMTGNPNLARAEDFLSRVQGGAGVMQDFRAGNQRQLNKIAASAMGENTDAVTQDVFAASGKRLGGTFDTLRNQAQMPVSAQIIDSITRSEKMLNRGLGSVNGKDEALSLLAELKDRLYNTKQLSGEDYQAIASDLTTAARQTQNQTIAAALKEVRKAMDREAQGPNAPAWQQANAEYAARKTLLKPKAVNEQTGDVNPSAIATAMQQQFGDRLKTGAVQGPLADITAYAKALPAARAGSPTLERQKAGSIMDWVLSPGYYAAAKGLTGDLGRSYLSRGLLGDAGISNAAGQAIGRAALPLAVSPAEQALFSMGLLGYAQ